MKIILNLPKSANWIAAGLMADGFKTEDIEAAIKMCEENPTELDISKLKEVAGTDNSDIQAFNVGIAIVAIGMRMEEVKKSKEAEK